MEAVTGEQEDIADLLLQQPGLDLALRDTCGNTALHLAAIRGSQGLVRRLTQAVWVRIQCILMGADKQGRAEMESAKNVKRKFRKYMLNTYSYIFFYIMSSSSRNTVRKNVNKHTK